MVMHSSQISGMVGGQMAMFSNSASYSQQLSGLYGTGPSQQGMAGMSNPFPASQAGAGMVSGVTGMAGGMMGAASLAGGFMGGGAGMLDPFTGVGKAFGAGRAAAGGAGMMGVAGGMAAAAPMAAAYYAGGSAIMGAAENIGAGARNIADVGMLAQTHMGSQAGSPGATAGGGMGRGQIKQMVGVLEELAGDDTMATMDSLKRLMDKAGQSGMLQGIGDAQQFKQKFGGMVKQMKNMAQVMGTSLEEAAPLFGQMQQMGMWRTSDIMGTAGAMKTAGAAAPQLMGAMQQGSQISHAMGGRLGAGAVQGREMFMQVQAATSAGLLSNEQLREFTGGTGGARGQQMMAQKLQGAGSQFGKTAAGRMMMAGLGKFEGGRFTGGIDEGAMEEFMSGEVSMSDLQRTGQKRSSSSREAATSFSVREGAIGQEMMAQGGIGAISQAMNQVMKHAGMEGKGEDIQNMFIQKMTGVDARTAEMIKKFGKDMPRIQEEKQRKLEATLDSQFQEMERKMNRSWSGFSSAWENAQEAAWQPFRDLGADMATGVGRRMDRASDAMMGRTKRFSMSSSGRTRAFRSEGLGDSGGLSLSAGESSGLGDTSMAARMRNLTGDTMAPAALMAGAMGMSLGSNAEALGRLGADVEYGGSAGEGWASAGTTVPLVGQSVNVNVSQKSEVVRQARARSENRTWKGLGFEGDKSTKDTTNLDIAKRGIRRLFGDARFAAKWAEYKEGNGNAQDQVRAIMARLRTEDPKTAQALSELAGRSGSGGKGIMREMDAIALAAEEAGSESLIDFDKAKEDATGMGLLTSPAAYDEAISKTLATAAGEDSLGVRVAKGAAMGSTMAGPLGALVGAGLGAIGLVGGADEELRSSLEEATQNEDWGADAAKYYQGGRDGGEENRYSRALARGDSRATEFAKQMEESGLTDDQIGGALSKSMGHMKDKERMKARSRIAGESKTQLRELRRKGGGKGLGDTTKGDLEELLAIYSSDDFKEGTNTEVFERAEALAGKLSQVTGKERGALSRTGAVGKQAARTGRVVGRLGKLDKDAELDDIEAITGALPTEMKEAISKMIASDGLDKDEVKSIQEKFRGAAARGGPTSSKDKTDSMTEIMTAYTNANTKFVFAVGAAVSGMKEEDVEQMKAAGKAAVEAQGMKKATSSTQPA